MATVIQHMRSKEVGSEHNWLLLKNFNIPSFSSPYVLYFVENMDPEGSDVINFVIILCKPFPYLCKW